MVTRVDSMALQELSKSAEYWYRLGRVKCTQRSHISPRRIHVLLPYCYRLLPLPPAAQIVCDHLMRVWPCHRLQHKLEGPFPYR